jgi:hypothetical protein
MPEQELVENFKITPEMKKFAKNYRKFNDISTRLRGKLEIQLSEADQTRQMLGQVEKGMQLLLQSAPQKPTFETEQDMDSSGEEEDAPMPSGMTPQGQTMNPMMNY